MISVAARSRDFFDVPVLDLARADGGPVAERALAGDLRHAAIEVGFFYVVGHGVPQIAITKPATGVRNPISRQIPQATSSTQRTTISSVQPPR